MADVLAALSATRAFLIGIGVGVGLLVLVLGFAAGRRRPGRRELLDIPPGMRPGPADPDLENNLVVRHYRSVIAAVAVLAIWMPAVWLFEPRTNAADAQATAEASVERGRLTTLPGSEANPLGFNCARCHGTELQGGQNVFNGNIVSVPNLQTVCGGAELGHPLIKSLSDVIATIAEGREGTDMPSWSVRFAGAMDDQQIQDLVNYILSIQKVPPDKNLCLQTQTAAG